MENPIKILDLVVLGFPLFLETPKYDNKENLHMGFLLAFCTVVESSTACRKATNMSHVFCSFRGE